MAILKIEACVSCGTPASSTVISAAYVAQIQRKGGFHECTSGSDIEGGGPCCQLLAYTAATLIALHLPTANQSVGKTPRQSRRSFLL